MDKSAAEQCRGPSFSQTWGLWERQGGAELCVQRRGNSVKAVGREVTLRLQDPVILSTKPLELHDPLGVVMLSTLSAFALFPPVDHKLPKGEGPCWSLGHPPSARMQLGEL